jgi:hypothetical protein
MKQCLLIVTLGASLVLSACALFPRRDTVAYPAAGGPVPPPAGLYVDTVDVDRRVLATEVARDVKELIPVLAPGHGFAVVPSSQEGAWPMRVHVVERETIRDFSPQFAVMVSLEMYSSADAPQPTLTVVHTSESTDSITSPWVLKRILNDCLQEAAKGFAAKRGG